MRVKERKTVTRRGADIGPRDGAAVLGGSLLGRLTGPVLVLSAAVLATAMVSGVYPGAGAAVLVCAAVVLAWSIARAGRLAVVATSQALVVVNPFRTVRIDWDNIASVRHVQTQWTSTPRVHRTGASAVSVIALSGRFNDVRYEWYVESADVVGDRGVARDMLAELTSQR